MAASSSVQTAGNKGPWGSVATALCREAFADSICSMREWIMLSRALTGAVRGA